MTLLVDAVIIAAVIYGAYAGSRRGLLLVVMELVSLVVSTALAAVLYVPAGRLLEATGLTPPRGRVIAFMALWIVAEISFSLFVRFFALPRLKNYPGHNRLGRIAGATINGAKVAMVMVVAVIAFDGLPIPAAAKDAVTTAAVPGSILSHYTGLRTAWSNGIGRDITQSLSVFVITDDPESRLRIELNFRTTDGHIDEAAENTMLRLLNDERTSRGLMPLTLNTGARGVARAYSARMLAEGYFSHIDNDGRTPFDRLRASHVDFGAAGENLALAPTLQRAHDGLINSPGHRANILSKNYRSVGIGIINAGANGLMITQDFTD